ncbi:hypothetical protein DLM45_01285 [Hyphomicrobium methylovorum]|nr:DUF2865 domain-containing protein [Hyphomicrobium methylovorum]MBA2124858.1 hypothetical protein [Hyphomicrobium methylovorum]
MHKFDHRFEAPGVSQAIAHLHIIRRLLLAFVAVAATLSAVPNAASAQSWWPFGGNDEEAPRPPVPREPVYREPPGNVPAPIPPDNQPPPGAPPGYSNAPRPAPGAPSSAVGGGGSSTKGPICYQLEQRLVQEGQKSGQSRNQLPQIEDEIRTVDRAYRSGQQQLDRGCYESFLFTKTFRNSPQCKDLARQVELSKRKLADLEAKRQDIMGSSGRSYQDDIIRELARNNCGANYVDMARRRTDGMWEDEESSGNNTWSPSAALNGAQTFRTVCVRLCDGFYFPVSFSTLPSHFTQDADSCQSKCAAPTELYYYPNPGGSIDQSVALGSQEPYSKMKSAFRYRKEYVNGCSCKTAEFVPTDAAGKAKKAEVEAAAAASGGAAGQNAVNTGTMPPAAGAPADAGDAWHTEAQPQ